MCQAARELSRSGSDGRFQRTTAAGHISKQGSALLAFFAGGRGASDYAIIINSRPLQTVRLQPDQMVIHVSLVI